MAPPVETAPAFSAATSCQSIAQRPSGLSFIWLRFGRTATATVSRLNTTAVRQSDVTATADGVWPTGDVRTSNEAAFTRVTESLSGLAMNTNTSVSAGRKARWSSSFSAGTSGSAMSPSLPVSELLLPPRPVSRQ